MTYEDLLEQEPYGVLSDEKERMLGELLNRLTERHRDCCPAYDAACGLLGDRKGSRLCEIPLLPVSLFKKTELCSIPEDEIFKRLTSSGTTGQQTSRIVLDRRTAEWQQRTLERIVGSFIGGKRLPRRESCMTAICFQPEAREFWVFLCSGRDGAMRLRKRWSPIWMLSGNGLRQLRENLSWCSASLI